MITVGATAGGYVKGVEATAFSKWNWGITDRFKEEFTPGNQASITSAGSLDEAEVNYVNKFLLNNGYVTRYGFPSFSGADFKLSDDIIEGNISVGTEYFKYIVAKSKSSSGGTIGFIPFKISFTMDGLSGIKIYNKLNVDTRFLPRAYGNNLDLIVTGVSHKLSNSDWETDIEATVIPKTKLDNSGAITSQIIQQSIEQVKSAPQTPTQKPQKNPPSDLIKAMKEYGITSPLEKAHFLAQVSHESGRFQYREELASGKAYEGRKDLGNTQPGDGVRFKGRGYIQVTGRANYTKYNQYLKSRGITDDIVKNPSLVATKYAADVSAWYWTVLGPSGVKKFPKKAKEGDTLVVINKIGTWVNGGNPPNGAQDRISKFNYYWDILKNNPNAFS